MWILAIIILLLCFREVFGKPILWLSLGGIVGYFICKHKVAEKITQKFKEVKDSSAQSEDVMFYKRLAQEMLEENIKLRNQSK